MKVHSSATFAGISSALFAIKTRVAFSSTFTTTRPLSIS